MNILLSFYHFADDWQDDKSMKGLTGIHLFKKQARKISQEYPRQSRAIRMKLRKLSEYEKKQETDPVSYTHLDVYKRQAQGLWQSHCRSRWGYSPG